MRYRRLQWTAAATVAGEIRSWFELDADRIDVTGIEREIATGGDAALRDLTARFDATGRSADDLTLSVPLERAEKALKETDPDVVEALRIAIGNVRAVAEAQLGVGERPVELPQGQTVTVGETAVAAAGIYAPGGRASYPSTVVMGCVPARVAGVERVVLVSPPGPDGEINRTTLAAAALCDVDEIYAVGGAQAIFALARGTETVAPVDVIAGPGNDWVQAAKRTVFGEVGIDSLAGPSDLTVVLDRSVNLEWAALDLCAQAEHGPESTLVVIATEADVLDRLVGTIDRISATQPSVNDCRIALVEAPGAAAAVKLANAIAPEHLQLMDPASAALAGQVRTAGCVFAGPEAGTSFGDYIAGSNHVLPTGGTGRIFGPLSPTTFRRATARVSLTPAAVDRLAGPLDALARAEGLPVHGLSATKRSSAAATHKQETK